MLYRTISADRQVTLGKEILEHLGVKAGYKLDCKFLPDGRVVLRAAAKGDSQDRRSKKPG